MNTVQELIIYYLIKCNIIDEMEIVEVYAVCVDERIFRGAVNNFGQIVSPFLTLHSIVSLSVVSCSLTLAVAF